MKNSNRILYLIFFITVIPTTYVYFEHGQEEIETAENATSEYKKTKAMGEGILFLSIGWGYTLTTLAVIINPKSRIPYTVLIVGTVVIVILYYFRIYGIPVPGTDVIIRDISTDWRDVITKICQEIMVIPLTALLLIRRSSAD